MAGFGFVFGGSGLVRIYCQYSGSGHFHPGSNCTGKEAQSFFIPYSDGKLDI